jgi:hypothetical protein
MARLISRAELARLAGVSAPAITKACKKQLAAACHRHRVDLDHPAVQEYLASKGRKGDLPGVQAKSRAASAAGAQKSDSDRAPTSPGKTKGAASAAPTNSARARAGATPVATEPPPKPESQQRSVRVVSREVESDVGAIADMTIREVVQKFGTVTAFKDWLMALKAIEGVREKNLRNAETEGRLISRDLVQTHVMGAIEACNKRLLRDAPKTIASRVFAVVRGGRTVEEGEQLVREAISKHLRPVKVTAARVLRSKDGESSSSGGGSRQER